MKVALGTLEIDENTRRKIGKAVHGSSYLKRDQARDWALGLIDDEIARITADPPPQEEVAEEESPVITGQETPAQGAPTGDAPVFSSSGI